MLSPEKTESVYQRQFRDGNALTRGIMKFCPQCIDGECFHPKAKNYSTTKQINNNSGGCWMMVEKGCPLHTIDGVIRDMQNSGRWYVNPLFEENPKPCEFPIEPDEAAEIWQRINPDIRRCSCGEPLKKGRQVCDGCKQ